MRFYENAVTKMPVMGCKDCPNRKKLSHSPFSSIICKAMTRYEKKNTISGEGKIPIYTNISEYIKEGGFHPNCPLPDFKR